MNNYSAWNISEWDYPKEGSTEDKIKYFSRYGLLAANLHNTQPWRFRIIKNQLQILPNLKYHLPKVDPSKKYLYISLGCCVKNIEVIAAYHQFGTEIKISPKGVISLFFKNAEMRTLIGDLAPYITKRYSNKMPYANVPVEKKHFEELKKTELPSTLNLVFNKDKDVTRKLGALQKEA